MLIEHALQYAGRGWRVFPAHTTARGACSCGRNCGKDAGKHPRIKAWQKAATTDPAQITRWWARWPDANIAVATGALPERLGLIVLDLDGPAELERFKALAAPHGGLPPTLVARTGRGFHVYLMGGLPSSKKVDGLLVRGEGGYVIAPPSLHASGQHYQWVQDVPLSHAPDWFMVWALSGGNPNNTNGVTLGLGPLSLQNKPAYLNGKNKQDQGSITKRASFGLTQVPQTPAELARIVSALAAVPASCARDPWLHAGFALHSLNWERPDGTNTGFDLWNEWSATCPDKYSLFDVQTRWKSFGKEGRAGVTIGTLYHLAEQHGWTGLAPRAADDSEVVLHSGTDRSQQTDDQLRNPQGRDNAMPHPVIDSPGGAANGHGAAKVFLPDTLTTNESPLIRLNEQYSCIGDIGGKCLVLGWVPSKVDPAIRVPSFQGFKSFAERYANQYVLVNKKKGDGYEEESAQLGTTWLKWRHRKSFEGIDLVPGEPGILPGNIMNLWCGFATDPVPGRWDLMKAHIAEILAEGDATSLDYIMRWSAWAVQNPGERAEVALVFRGDKGSGKGTFGNAMRRLFGQHGLQIFNSKHLVGAFNAHLRNCLLLFADEAFWAGDRQGESTLKGLITESVTMIEQKGVDAAQWKNRIHLIMAANAEWVVPASHDERRYAVFNVSNKRLKDEKYFVALHHEMQSGGLAAMLHDLLRVDLGDWHPRRIPNTTALRQQKARSMTSLQEWWESLLQEAVIPAAPKESPDTAYAQYLMNHCRDYAPRLKELTPAALGRFLHEQGCVKIHRGTGNAWRFPALDKAREHWTRRYQGWDWEREASGWVART